MKKICCALACMMALLLAITGTACAAPVITVQPSDAHAYEGESIRIAVEAEGDDLSYQWYYKSPDEEKYKKTSSEAGMTASYSLKMTDKRDGRQMYCRVTDKNGDSVNSRVVTLKTRYRAEIVKEPSHAYVPEGEKASVRVKAKGDGVTYQWYCRKPGSDDFTRTSVVTAKYAVTINRKNSGLKAYCIVKDKYGNEVKSRTVTLKIQESVKITGQPSNVTKAVGEKARTAVKATGDGLKYQWYYRNPGSSKFKKSSVTRETYVTTVTKKMSGREVYCVVTDAFGNKAQTKTVTLKAKTGKK